MSAPGNPVSLAGQRPPAAARQSPERYGMPGIR